MNNELLWNKFLENVKSSVNSMVFSAWFDKTYLVSLDNNKATIVVPLDIHKKRLKEIYGELITNILNKLTGNIYDLNFVLENEVQIKKEEKKIDEVKMQEITQKFKHNSNLNPKYTFDLHMQLLLLLHNLQDLPIIPYLFMAIVVLEKLI